MKTVAALFVDSRGPYASMPGVECWDEVRDARKYGGPHPVVAHPPCQLWTNFAALNFKRWGGEHNRPGNDGGCFASALANVRRYGGVLEHPAYSKAWESHGLRAPLSHGVWFAHAPGEWVCQVMQSAYGHLAQKKTWLFFVSDRAPADADWSQPPGSHQCGWFDRIKPTLSKRAASLTPQPFADFLVSLARGARHL